MKQKFYKKLQTSALSLLLLLGLAIGQTQAQNNALDFDGTDDYVSVPHTAARDFGTGDFTTECWFNSSGTGNIPALISWRSAGPVVNSYALYFNSSNNNILVLMGGSNAIVASNAVVTNTWQHIAVTRASGILRVYLDGTLVYTSTSPAYTSNVNNGTFPMTIGRDNGNPTQTQFNGQIDEVRIWNVARTCSEIKANLNNELTGLETGLVAYYNFNQGTAGGDNTGLTTLNDGVTVPNNGTLTNFNGLDGSVDGGATSNWVDASANGVSGTTPIPQPEINVTAAASGGTNDVGGHTAGTPVTFTYTIQNTGGGDLMLTGGSPLVAESGDAAFTVSTQPSISTITGASSTTFVITYTPVANTVSSTLFTIANTDCDEGTYTFTLTGKGINATPTLKRGNMLTSTDAGFVDAGNATALNFERTNTFSIEAWVKTSDTDGFIFGKAVPGATAQGYSLVFISSKISFGMNNDLSTGNSIGISTVANYNDNAWHHVVGTYDGSSTAAGLTIYVDGVAVPTTANPTALTGDIANAGNAQIGTALAGSLDEVRIWNTTLTQDDIRENMHLTLKGSETGLVGYYQFNEDTGNAIDAIDGNNGVLTGATRATSEVEVSNGFSKKTTVGAAGTPGTNEISISTTNLAIDFGATAPNGDVWVYYLNDTPIADDIVGVNSNSDRHWVVRNFGTNLTGLDIASMTFQVPNHNIISALDETTPANLKIYKRGSADFLLADWAEVGEVTSASNTSKQVVLDGTAGTAVSSFSQFVVTSAGTSPLPVTLLTFEAERSNQEEVQLTWATASEIDNLGFEIEMSEDGQTFAQVGFVDGVGNSSALRNYAFTHNNSKAAYYRLKQKDLDGSFSRSQLRFVEALQSVRKLAVYPNPTVGNITLSLGEYFPAEEQVTVQLLDARGGLILSGSSTLDKTAQALNEQLSNAPKGLYFLQIQTKTERFVKRIMVQ
jgi:hypothetical protein